MLVRTRVEDAIEKSFPPAKAVDERINPRTGQLEGDLVFRGFYITQSEVGSRALEARAEHGHRAASYLLASRNGKVIFPSWLGLERSS
jgi:hypothetical protein